jgi:hypothetical protein
MSIFLGDKMTELLVILAVLGLLVSVIFVGLCDHRL